MVNINQDYLLSQLSTWSVAAGTASWLLTGDISTFSTLNHNSPVVEQFVYVWLLLTVQCLLKVAYFLTYCN